MGPLFLRLTYKVSQEKRFLFEDKGGGSFLLFFSSKLVISVDYLLRETIRTDVTELRLGSLQL